jgi:hypothetical protein
MSTFPLKSAAAAPFSTPVNPRYDSLAEVANANVQSLLAHYGIDAGEPVCADAPCAARWIMASIGFAGEHASGALTIVAASRFWRAYAPRIECNPDAPEALLADMAGEFVNMVMGRIRNDVLRLSVVVHQATPTCAFGDEIAFRDPGSAHAQWCRFATSNGDLWVRLDADLRESFVLGFTNAVQPFEQDLLFF